MIKIALTALSLALLALPQANSTAHAAGLEAARIDVSAAKRRNAKKPRIIRSSTKYPGGRCGKLNLERARLYGLCR
jgi:hypothetical protein